MEMHFVSPRPWRISDSHGLCIVDFNGEIVADFTPRNDWANVPSYNILRANAEFIVGLVNRTY